MKRLDGFEALYAAALWLWVCGNAVFALGLAARLNPATLVALTALLTAGLVMIAVQARAARGAVARAATAYPVLFAALVLVVLLEAIPALAPPTARDALIHHLAIPHLFLQSGRIVDIPFAVQSYYPQTADMLYLIPVGLGADWVAGFIHLGFGLLASGVLAVRARRWAGDRAGILAAVLFLGLPIVARIAGAAYVDLALCFYIFLALEAFLRWCEAGQRGYWLALSAVALGFALSVKYSALVAAASLGVLVFRESARHRGLLAAVARVAIFGSLVLLPATPWLARNAMLRGNPVYPLFPSLFRSVPAPGVGEPGALAQRVLLYGESLPAIAALPVRIFVLGEDDNPRRFDGRLNPFVAFLAAAFLLAGGRGHPSQGGWAVGIFSALGVLFTLVSASARARYVLPYAGALCAIAAAALPEKAERGVLGRGIPITLLVAALSWNAFFLVRPLRDPALVAYLTGIESREAYLSSKLPAFPLWEAANAHVGGRGRVQLLFMGDQGYYLHVPYIYESWFSGRGLAMALPGGASAVAAYFRERGVTHLLVNEAILGEFLAGLRDVSAPRVWEAFARTGLSPLARRGPFALYEIRETSENTQVTLHAPLKNPGR